MEPALFYYNIRDKKIALRIVRVCAQEDNGILASGDIALHTIAFHLALLA